MTVIISPAFTISSVSVKCQNFKLSMSQFQTITQANVKCQNLIYGQYAQCSTSLYLSLLYLWHVKALCYHKLTHFWGQGKFITFFICLTKWSMFIYRWFQRVISALWNGIDRIGRMTPHNIAVEVVHLRFTRTKHLRSKCESHFDPRRLRRLTGCYVPVVRTWQFKIWVHWENL